MLFFGEDGVVGLEVVFAEGGFISMDRPIVVSIFVAARNIERCS